MEKTKDQILMERLLNERKEVQKQFNVLKERLRELNFALAIVIQRRYENEFDEEKEPE